MNSWDEKFWKGYVYGYIMGEGSKRRKEKKLMKMIKKYSRLKSELSNLKNWYYDLKENPEHLESFLNWLYEFLKEWSLI